MNNTWIANVVVSEEDPQEFYLQFPDDLMNKLNWQPGDLLLWDIEENGNIRIRKKEEQE